MNRWEVIFDFQLVPPGDFVDVLFEYHSPGSFMKRGESSTTLVFNIVKAETAELTTWILMPKGHEYRSFRILRYPRGSPEKVEEVKLVTEYLADDSTILAFKLLALKPGYIYELTWLYK